MITSSAPGQGSQTPHAPLPAWRVERTGRARPRPPRYDGRREEIKDTAVTQPLIVALGAIVHRRLGLDGGPEDGPERIRCGRRR